MANRFLNSISINDEYTLPENDGSAGQAIITDGSGNLSFGSTVASSADSSESIHITVKNTSGATITKGTPVYITGETGNSGKIEVAPADASDSAKMPAVGILESTLSDNAEGFCVQGGLLEGLVTDTIDGTTTTANDTVYVKSGGGLTMTKPTGSDNLIQNIAKVARTHASNGSLIVSSILRTNDVPNLPEGRIWVGDGNTLVSDTVYVDEPNNRVGIGTDSPGTKLHVLGNVIFDGHSASDPDSTSRLAYSADQMFTHYDNNGVSIIGGKGSYTGVGLTIGEETTRSTNFKFIRGVSDTNGGANAAEEFWVDGAGGAYFAGNVGIGTTSPQASLQIGGNVGTSSEKLDVRGNSSANYVASFEQDHITGYGVLIDTDGTLVSEPALKIKNQGGNILYVGSNGNVGIGTDSPNGKLQFSNDVETRKIVLYEGGDNDFQFYGFGIEANKLVYTTAFNDDDHVFYSGASATTRNELMRIEGGGNVGIGTTSPVSRLHTIGEIVGGTTGFTSGMNGFTGLGSYDSSTAVENIDSLYLRKGGTNGSSTSIAFGSAGGDDYFVGSRIKHIRSGSNSKGHLAFETKGDTSTNTTSERMRITDEGNVGIGTTSPQAPLVISNSSTDGLEFHNSISSNSRIISYKRSNNTFRPLRLEALTHIFGISGNEKMRITSGGELIINGTTSTYGVSQGYPLHVKGTSSQGYVSICRGTQNSGSEGLIVGTDSSNAYLLSRDNISLILGTNNLSHVFIKPNGNVGIGTTSPDYKLDVGGNARFQDSVYINTSAGSGGLYVTRQGSSVESLKIYTSDSTSVFETFQDENTGEYGSMAFILDNGAPDPSYVFRYGSIVRLKIEGGTGDVILKDALLSNQKNTNVDTGAEVVALVAHATYTAAFFDFVVKKGTNIRSGTVYACHNGDTTPLVEFTETSTNDLGDTSDVTLSVDISGANMRLLATVTSDDWSVKSLIRAI